MLGGAPAAQKRPREKQGIQYGKATLPKIWNSSVLLQRTFSLVYRMARSKPHVLNAEIYWRGVSKARLRWQPILPPESADRMGKTVKRVRDISSNLSEPGRQLSPEERRKLLDFAHNVVIDLAEEAGRMLSELERRK
jgi:hypothetical protein